MKKLALVALLALILTGCIDDRIKRQSSLLNVKTQVAAKEYKAADTPDKKVAVADEYFRTAPAMTQIMDDYMQGKDPQKPQVDPVPNP
jgi:PBP1b-binding outer membrane lipoprotein LpoB